MGTTRSPTTRRVMVVDDNTDAANSVASLLRLHGQEVKQAYDGPSAVRMAGEFKPDIIFLDLVMPGLDGFAVARQLRAMESMKSAKIIALTAFGQPAFKQATTDAGFDGHLLKPATAAELVLALAS